MPKKKSKNSGNGAVLEGLQTELGIVEESAEEKPFALNPEAENLRDFQKKLSVTLTPDGGFDFQAMREDTIKKIKTALSNPQTAAFLSANGQKMPEIISDQEISLLYDLIATIETFAFSMAGKIDIDIAQKHAAWTPEQKAMVMAPSKVVIIKHMNPDSFLFKWKDEIVLTGLLLMITRAKYEGARHEQANRNEQRARENPNPATVEAAPPVQ